LITSVDGLQSLVKSGRGQAGTCKVSDHGPQPKQRALLSDFEGIFHNNMMISNWQFTINNENWGLHCYEK
jgi:hypothetical protein